MGGLGGGGGEQCWLSGAQHPCGSPRIEINLGKQIHCDSVYQFQTLPTQCITENQQLPTGSVLESGIWVLEGKGGGGLGAFTENGL